MLTYFYSVLVIVRLAPYSASLSFSSALFNSFIVPPPKRKALITSAYLINGNQSLASLRVLYAFLIKLFSSKY